MSGRQRPVGGGRGQAPFSGVVSDCAPPEPATRGVAQPRYSSKLQSADLDSGYLSSQLLSDENLSSLPPPSHAQPLRPLSPSSQKCVTSTHSLPHTYRDVRLSKDDTSSLRLDSGVDLNVSGMDTEAEACSMVSELGRLNVAPNPEMSEEERRAWEERYLATLQEAFSGDEDGDTHLHLAIIYGFGDVAEKLIGLVPHQNFLNFTNSYRQTVLHLSVLRGDAGMTRRLVVAGADPTLTDRHGDTALHVACQRADRGCVHALTEPVTAAEIRRLSQRYSCTPTPITAEHIDQWNYQGLSCLHLAVMSRDVEVAAHLVCHGASIDAREGKAGRAACHLVAEAGDIEMLRFLAEACRVKLNATTYAGLTAYQLASLNGRWDVAELLIQLGASCLQLPDSDMESDSDTDSDDVVKPEDLYGDVRIRGQPLVAAQ